MKNIPEKMYLQIGEDADLEVVGINRRGKNRQ